MYLELIDEFAAKGRYCFSFNEIAEKLDASPVAIKSALNRLKKKGELAVPYQEFYVILPPEHRVRGCLPPQQFIPHLMHHLGEVYYTGLLSAAEFHGAAHHRPQVFQVVVAKARRPIECGQIRVEFIFRKNAAVIPTEPRNTTAGIIQISTPEATALDLIGYVRHCAGLDNVATVLAELVEKIDIRQLAEVAALSPVAWAQRLGYILELLGENDKANVLADSLQGLHFMPTPLVPGCDIKGAKKNSRWQVFINSEVEPDI
ncbi:type IV toxin-antitoxin system AbiEi family antitoxin [Geotalea toluenoxydans]